MELQVQVALAIDQIEKLLAALKSAPDADQRAIAVARTHFETALLWSASAAAGGSVLNG